MAKNDNSPWGDAVTPTKNYAAIEKVKDREKNKVANRGGTLADAAAAVRTKNNSKSLGDPNALEWF